jgi:hypothetical protein
MPFHRTPTDIETHEDIDLSPSELNFINSIVNSTDVLKYIKERTNHHTEELKELKVKVEASINEIYEHLSIAVERLDSKTKALIPRVEDCEKMATSLHNSYIEVRLYW